MSKSQYKGTLLCLRRNKEELVCMGHPSPSYNSRRDRDSALQEGQQNHLASPFFDVFSEEVLLDVEMEVVGLVAGAVLP